jgi:hypothetical protein
MKTLFKPLLVVLAFALGGLLCMLPVSNTKNNKNALGINQSVESYASHSLSGPCWKSGTCEDDKPKETTPEKPKK